MDIALIEKFYDVKVRDLFLLDRHFGTGIYLMDAEEGKYIVKVLPVCVENVDREGMIAEYLWKHGLKVARFLKNKDGSFSVKTSENQFTVQQYVEGHTLPVNSAPEWVLNETADYLAEAIRLLQAYEGLPRRFGKEFFSKETVIAKKAEYEKELDLARTLGENEVIPIWEEQIRHLGKIASFNIETKKLTYANSHGDYHIGQVILSGDGITVVDWASVCSLPICLEIATSYVFACHTCADGIVDAAGLKKYIDRIGQKVTLTEYDIKAMPYVLYYWHCMCNYRPDEIADIADSYRPIANLISAFLNWLYDHVDELSEQLSDGV